LIIPDLFPKFDGDVQGIFVLDYLTSTANYCNHKVLFGKLTFKKKEVLFEKNEHYDVYRFSVSDKKIPFYLKPFFYLNWFFKGYNIGKKIKNIDIIHAHGSILSGTLAYMLSKKLKVPFLITEHQGPFSMTADHFWKKHWTKFIMQKADAVLTVSEHLKQEILNAGISPKKIIVSYNPVDTELFKLKKNQLSNTILFVGRLDEFKGSLRCLKAFHQINQQYPHWKFKIVGDGQEMQSIINYINSNASIKPKVILRGLLSKPEIADEMQNSDFLVFPSKHESFGLVVTEALSSGLPVIVGNKTAPIEFVDAENGLMVHYDDIHQIAHAMEMMIQNANNYQAENIREKVIKNFSFENFGKNLVNTYKSFILKP